MREVKVEVIGTEPPCGRCRATEKNAEKAAAKVKKEGINVTIEKLNVLSKDVVVKYRNLMPPALAVNGVIKTMGRVPNDGEIEKLLRAAAK